MTKIVIPAGLMNDNIELFKAPCETMMATHNGAVKFLWQLPSQFLEALNNHLNDRPSAIAALDAAGFKNHRDQLEKYCACNFSNFDLTADFKDGELSESEYHECGYRGSCPMEGIVCGFFKVNGEILSHLEIEILKLCATEDTLPVMAEKLKISINNLDEKKKVLFQKFKVQSRPRLVAVAYNLQILNPQLCSNKFH